MNPQFFDAAFIHIKSHYCSYFANCRIGLKTKPFTLKDLLVTLHCEILDHNIIKFPLSPTDNKTVKKTLFLEFEQFYNKTYIQYLDYLERQTHIRRHGSSNTWIFVTFYYLMFFSATALSRLFRTGLIYIDGEYKNKINKHIFNQHARFISTGTYSYSFSENASLLQLSKITSSIHEATWHNFQDQLEIMLTNSLPGLEQDLLKQIKSSTNKYGVNFPSKLRNDINYKGKFAIEELRQNVPEFTHKTFSSFLAVSHAKNDFLQNKLQTSFYIGLYLFSLIDLLYKDVKDRQSYNCPFSKLRNNLRNYDVNATYDFYALCI